MREAILMTLVALFLVGASMTISYLESKLAECQSVIDEGGSDD